MTSDNFDAEVEQGADEEFSDAPAEETEAAPAKELPVTPAELARAARPNSAGISSLTRALGLKLRGAQA